MRHRGESLSSGKERDGRLVEKGHYVFKGLWVDINEATSEGECRSEGTKSLAQKLDKRVGIGKYRRGEVRCLYRCLSRLIKFFPGDATNFKVSSTNFVQRGVVSDLFYAITPTFHLPSPLLYACGVCDHTHAS
jgi:hypothetical protein